MEVDEERTTLDEGEPRHRPGEWEDGTTVEESTLAQGKAYRDANNPFHPEVAGSTTNTTATNGQTLDELTVEEHARPLPPLQLVPSQPAMMATSTAKLIVVAGTDTGREFDVIAGNPISIGRAVDNDVVLTDISVSRKHFELLYDNDRWILRDRGSGNGTLINDRMEDASCQLYHGDRIEIGNTAFRFDHPASAMKSAPVGWSQRDDEEARTIAGKAPSAPLDVPGGPIARPVSTLPGTPGSGRREAQKSVPPIARARTHTGPSGGIAAGGATPGLPAHPPGMVPGTAAPNAMTMAPTGHPQSYPVMVSAPNAPTMAPFMAQPPAQAMPEPMRLGGSQPMISDYPSASPAELAAVGRYPSSCAMASRQSAPPQQMVAPIAMVAVPEQRPRGRWAVIGGVAIVVASIGITAAALGSSAATAAKPAITPPTLPKGLKLAKNDQQAGVGAGVGTAKPIETTTGTTDVQPDPITVDPVDTAKPGDGGTTPDTAVATTDDAAAKKAAADAEQKRLADEATKKAAADAEQKRLADEAAKKAAADAEQKRLADEGKRNDAQKRSDDKKLRDAEAKAERERKLQAKREAAEQKRIAAAEAKARRLKEREEQQRDNGTSDTGTSSGGGASDAEIARAEDKATGQYQAGNFREAAATLDAAAKGAESGRADDLRTKAASYRQIQAGIAAGQTEASTKAVETLSKLKFALAADKKVGGEFQTKIGDLIAVAAPRAAVSHMTKNNYESAFAATNDAINHGAGGNTNVKNVRKTLESRAGEFYSAGTKALANGDSDGKTQLQRVLKIVAKDSPWYSRAQKALANAKSS